MSSISNVSQPITVNQEASINKQKVEVFEKLENISCQLYKIYHLGLQENEVFFLDDKEFKKVNLSRCQPSEDIGENQYHFGDMTSQGVSDVKSLVGKLMGSPSDYQTGNLTKNLFKNIGNACVTLYKGSVVAAKLDDINVNYVGECFRKSHETCNRINAYIVQFKEDLISVLNSQQLTVEERVFIIAHFNDFNKGYDKEIKKAFQCNIATFEKLKNLSTIDMAKALQEVQQKMDNNIQSVFETINQKN